MQQVAVLVPPRDSYHRDVLHGIYSFVRQAKHPWSVYMEYNPQVRMPNLNHWEGDGIITSFNNKNVIKSLARIDVPIVGLGTGGYQPIDESIPYAYVGSDHQDISRMAFEYFYNLGLRRFAYCGAPANGKKSWSDRRGQAFREMTEEAGCHCDLFTANLNTRLNTWPQVLKRVQYWLESLTPPVGLMASCDRRGRLLLDALRAMRANVPEDFAVIGVDSDPILCNLSLPTLTSVRPDTHHIGFLAAELLHRMMSGERLTEQLYSVKALRVDARRSTDLLAIEDDEIASALRFIRKHACNPIQVRDVLSAIPLSRSTLENRFKKVVGRSIHAEIRRIQLEKAKNLLSETDLSLPVVANRAGIQTVQYLTTLMHKEIGTTPAKYRSLVRTKSLDTNMASYEI
jgi:LacI family transcriptional regulator